MLLRILQFHNKAPKPPWILLDLFQIRIQRRDEYLPVLSPWGETRAVGDQALVAVRIEADPILKLG